MTLAKSLSDELARVVGDHNASRSRHSLRSIGVQLEDGDAPVWWLRPGSPAEVAELVRIANRERAAVLPIGGVGRAPRADSLRERPCFFVDSRRMDHVLHLDETSLVCHAQAGIAGLGLEKILHPRGLSIGDYPPATLSATLGGLLAVRTPGKSSPRHGFLEDAVLGVSAVLADGRAVHTRVAPRRATGPDLARALCGSEGTLGFITSAVLRIHRLPESRLLDAHAMPSFDAAMAAVRLALREDAAPAAVRVFDGADARAHLGDEVCRGGEAVLVTATAGPTDLATCDRDLIASAANAMGGRALGAGPAELWWRRRTGREMAQPAPPAPALQIAATPSAQIRVYRAVRAAAERIGVAVRAHASRFDADGAVLFFTFTETETGPPLAAGALADAVASASDAGAQAGGFLLGRKNPIVDPYFTALRKALDPNDIMNPSALA